MTGSDRAGRRLRPAGADDLGLRRALSDRLVPLLVGAMAFLAALALGGFVAASALGRHWETGAASALTVQVPDPGGVAAGAGLPAGRTRRDAVLAALQGAPGIAQARALGEGELNDLLRPWLGADAESLSLPLPAVIEVRLAQAGADLSALSARLRAAAPGTLVESHGMWVARLAALAHSIEACAAAVLALVGLVAAAVVVVATRAGLAARREAIEIVHGLGASDSYIAGRFAARTTGLAAMGALGGVLLALPVLALMGTLAAPLGDPAATAQAVPGAIDPGAGLPIALWAAVPVLPMVAAGMGWCAAQLTVRRWLRRLP